jgi:hypothetical protein
MPGAMRAVRRAGGPAIRAHRHPAPRRSAETGFFLKDLLVIGRVVQMARRLIPTAICAERVHMESAPHRQGQGSEKLSAAERADLRWGLERVLLRHAEGLDGVNGQRDLGRALQRALRHLPVVMLHDRRLPTGLLVEHLAIGPGGVTIIGGWTADDAPGSLTVERLRGIFGARADLLRDGASEDRTALVTPVLRRVATVRDVIDDMAPVAGALCFADEEQTARLRPLYVEGVTIAGPRAIAELAARDGDLHDYELAGLVDYLDGALPVALER